MSGVEWLYFPLILLIGELVLFKLIDILRRLFSGLVKLDEELSKDKSKDTSSKSDDSKEVKTKDVPKETTSEDKKPSESSALTVDAGKAYSMCPYVESDVVYGNYLNDFFSYDSGYVLSRDQYNSRETEMIRKKRYSIMDEMDADNIDDKAYKKISDIIQENNSKRTILDEFNGLSKEMKLLLINSMLNK